MNKIDYTGSSKLIEAICNAINYLLYRVDEDSDVTITPSLSSGVKIADYRIDASSGSLFAPEAHEIDVLPTYSSGTKIADIEIDGEPIGLYTPSLPDIHSVPAGGQTNQVLAKKSGSDYDLKWVTQSGGGGSGSPSPLYYDSEGYVCIDYSLLEVR